MRRADRQTNALPDRPTNRPMDTASYRGALSHLKTPLLSQIQSKLTQNHIKTKQKRRTNGRTDQPKQLGVGLRVRDKKEILPTADDFVSAIGQCLVQFFTRYSTEIFLI